MGETKECLLILKTLRNRNYFESISECLWHPSWKPLAISRAFQKLQWNRFPVAELNSVRATDTFSHERWEGQLRHLSYMYSYGGSKTVLLIILLLNLFILFSSSTFFLENVRWPFISPLFFRIYLAIAFSFMFFNFVTLLWGDFSLSLRLFLVFYFLSLCNKLSQI